MKTVSTNIFLVFCLLMSLQKSLTGQDSKNYQNLSFKEFLQKKVENDTNFVRQIYLHVKYPKAARTYQVEGMLEFLMIGHEDLRIEVIQVNPILNFENVVDQVEEALEKVIIDRRHPFVTRFKIYFDLDLDWYRRKDFDQFEFGLIDDEVFIISSFFNVPNLNKH